MREGVSSSDVIDQEGTSGSSVVRPGYRLERLLAGRVPNLQLDVFLLDLDCASAKLNTDCQVVLLAESFVRELKQ